MVLLIAFDQAVKIDCEIYLDEYVIIDINAFFNMLSLIEMLALKNLAKKIKCVNNRILQNIVKIF